MANNTFIELTVRPQDVEEFEFEASNGEKGEPLLDHISQGDIHPSDLTEKAHLPFVGWHGAHDGDYRACIVVCDGCGEIETFYSDNAGFMAEDYGPGDMASLRALRVDHTEQTLKASAGRIVNRYKFTAKMLSVLEQMRDTSSRNVRKKISQYASKVVNGPKKLTAKKKVAKKKGKK